MTKRDIAICLGHFYDQNVGLNMFLPTLLIKHIMSVCGRSDQEWDWHSAVPQDLLYILRASVALYFKIVHTHTAKCTIKHTMHAVNILLGAGDASDKMHATCHFLVQIHTVAGVTQHNVQLLSTGVYLSKATVLSIVYYEAVALVRTVQRSVELYNLLNRLGLYVHQDNVINLTDSSAVCFMSKTAPGQLEKKYSFLMSKAALHLLSIGTTPQKSVHFFSQNNKKRNTGKVFMADVISKLPPGFTEQELVVNLPKIWEQSLTWLHEPIESWTFVTDFPPNVTMKSCSAKQFKLHNVTTGEVCQSLLSSKIPISHFNILNESTANQSIIQSQHKCDNHGVKDDNFHLLMRRKLSKVDQKGSAWNILSLCKYYILKLRALCNMAMEERSVIRQKLLKTLTEKRSKFTPLWASCYTRCGLVPDLSCGAEHHRTTDIFFGQLQNLWPHFGEGGEKPAKDIMCILSLSLIHI